LLASDLFGPTPPVKAPTYLYYIFALPTRYTSYPYGFGSLDSQVLNSWPRNYEMHDHRSNSLVSRYLPKFSAEISNFTVGELGEILGTAPLLQATKADSESLRK
jgi:hypothetical protein